ncbi:hypothetical protein [uncultured Nocardioides sp.]|jgi:hypothetical protein|uniref:hypothetical protein n=1 Tax=uncultured Nocardioides sp. TaxID=198441 RepID=UPI0030F902BA
MSSTSERSLAVAGVRHAAAVLVDAACDVCAACAAGARLHCTRPLVEGRQLTAPMPRVVAEEMLEAVTAVAALVEAPPVGTVVVAAPADSSLAVLVRAVSPSRVLFAADLRDEALRADLGRLESSGRARVVVASGDVRAAVRAVRRGGHVCVGGSVLHAPSVTELVQREVSLVAPLDAAAVLGRVSTQVWSAAVAAAA